MIRATQFFSSSLLLLFFFSCAKAQTNKELSYLALGDSYTICESINPDQRWPLLLQRTLNKEGASIQNPKIIAKTGWRTDNMLSAAKKEVGNKKYDIVSLLIGVNNEFQGQSASNFQPQFVESLEYAIKHCSNGNKGVFVLSIPDYGYTPFGKKNQPRISKRIDQYNTVCQKIAKKYDVPFYNITDISRKGLDKTDLVAKDGLHPSAKQYQQWITLFSKQIFTLVQKF